MSITFSRLLTDRVLVRLEPQKTATSGGVLLVRDEPYRTGVVVAAGPGRWVKVKRRGAEGYREVLRPTEVREGERIVFPIGSVDTKVGKAVTHYLREDERVIREDDILFVIEDDTDVEVSR